MDDLDNANYDDTLAYAEKLSDDIVEFLPGAAKTDKESLTTWISENEPNYDPEDQNE